MMKTKLFPLASGLCLLLSGLCLLSSAAFASDKATPGQGTKTVAAAGTPVKLVASTRLVDSVEIFARKNDTTANTGVILLGFSPTGGQNHRVIAIGDALVISALPNKKIDLSVIYIDAATNGDGVVWTALQ